MKRENLKIRLLSYFLGLFIMTLGIAVSVKSNLGVSPVSSVPYTLTCIFGLEMGKATILFHAFLVLLQALLLRRKFKPGSLLQILVGIVFGYFTTFCNYLLSFAPAPEHLALRLIMAVVSALLIAFGLFLYVPAGLVPLAGEGLTLAVSQVTHIAFARAKVLFDVTVVGVSLVCCLIVLHAPGSVGLGTVLAALLVGNFLSLITRLLGSRRDRILKPSNESL